MPLAHWLSMNPLSVEMLVSAAIALPPWITVMISVSRRLRSGESSVDQVREPSGVAAQPRFRVESPASYPL